MKNKIFTLAIAIVILLAASQCTKQDNGLPQVPPNPYSSCMIISNKYIESPGKYVVKERGNLYSIYYVTAEAYDTIQIGHWYCP